MAATLVADGNIIPSRFVVQDAVTYRGIQASGVTVPIYGIAGPSTHLIPYGGLDDGFVAIQGLQFLVWTQDPFATDVLIECGGTVAAGDALTSDNVGRGITSTGAHDYIGATAKAPGTIGLLIPVDVRNYQRSS